MKFVQNFKFLKYGKNYAKVAARIKETVNIINSVRNSFLSCLKFARMKREQRKIKYFRCTGK